MSPFYVSRTLLLLVAFITTSSALQALTNSPCALQCGNVLGSTSGSDLVCEDSDYGSAPGTTFQSCVTCQLGSTYVDPVTNQTDLQWALYNLRYAVSWCLFGYPDNSAAGSSPCTTSFACGPIQESFEFDSLSPNSSDYKYCALIPQIDVPKCTSCLASTSGEFYLTNFVTALSAACIQQPTAGHTVSLQGNLFSTTAVNITNPSATPVSTYKGPTGGLTLGAKVGIAVGAVVAILAITGFCIVCHGRRRRRKALATHQQQTGYADWLAVQQTKNPDMPPSMSGGDMSAGGFYDSPQSQRHLFQGHAWGFPGAGEDESPASAMGEKIHFSPYSSQYSSPVSANEQAQVVSREWPLYRQGSGSGSPSGPARSRGVETEGDRIEMHNVAPVLLHPRNGRGVALTSPDPRGGHAI